MCGCSLVASWLLSGCFLVAFWLAGWLAGWLPGWLAGWLVGWLATYYHKKGKSSSKRSKLWIWQMQALRPTNTTRKHCQPIQFTICTPTWLVNSFIHEDFTSEWIDEYTSERTNERTNEWMSELSNWKAICMCLRFYPLSSIFYLCVVVGLKTGLEAACKDWDGSWDLDSPCVDLGCLRGYICASLGSFLKRLGTTEGHQKVEHKPLCIRFHNWS